MKEVLTELDSVNIPNFKTEAQGDSVLVSTQGNADDYTWCIEFTLDDGANWSKTKDNLGESIFTGADSKHIIVPSDKSRFGAEDSKRVTILTMGTATSITVVISS